MDYQANNEWKAYNNQYGAPEQTPFVAGPSQPMMMPEFVPQAPVKQQPDLAGFHNGPPLPRVRRQLFFWALRYVTVVVVVGVGLAIPIIVTRKDEVLDTADAVAKRAGQNLIFYLFSWLLVTWLAAVISDLIALSLPYLFRFLARYINPAHQKYWRVFKVMRRPISFLGCLLASYISFTVLINLNDELAVNFNRVDNPDIIPWDLAINDVLEQLTLWICFYFVEKVMLLYVTIHYHYRADHNKISHSKDMHDALVTLYEASIYLHSPHRGSFDVEDIIIRNAKGNETSTRVRVSSYLARMGIDGYKLASLFGNFFSNDAKAHWMRPASTYATVERALADPKAAAALARRIWMSLVVQGSEYMTAEDVAEVLGPYRREEATRCFKILDENESGDIRLDEMVLTVVEAGQIRHNIYQTMRDMDHCLNTFDWVCLTILGAVMVFFILVLYVPTIKQIQQTLSFIAIGLTFAIGRTFNHFLTGCVYVFFDHPFDIGDRVEIYNRPATIGVSAVVKRQSLLYTVFRRLDNGTDMQIANEVLAQERIENVTRSGANRQALSLFLAFKTTFQDLVFLRQELEAFLAAPENRRDYAPDLGLSIVNLHELNKMEVRVAVTHRSNWSNEKLRAARSNRFYCALVAAIRKIPLEQPGGAVLTGDEGKPMYTVQLRSDDADARVAAVAATRKAARIDASTAVEGSQLPPPAAAQGGEQGNAAAAAAAAPGPVPARAPAGPSPEVLAAREAEAQARARLSMVPKVDTNPGSGLAASTAVQVNEFIGISTTGLRQKPHGGAEAAYFRQ